MEFQGVTTQQSPNFPRSIAIHNEASLPPGVFRTIVPPLAESRNAGEVIKVQNKYYLLHEPVSTGETQITGELLTTGNKQEGSDGH